MHTSPLINNLLDYLGEEPIVGSDPNMTTLLRHGQAAQEWLLTQYLGSWLELVGGLVGCGYPLALAHRPMMHALSRLGEKLNPALSVTDQVFFLGSVHDHLQSILRRMNGFPDERSMQWGIWARDVPMAIVYGFSETSFLNPLICEGIVPCCMYAALLVSQVVTDDGVAEEIEDKMFEAKPRALAELLRELPAAPEA
jgi:hypothetical protein